MIKFKWPDGSERRVHIDPATFTDYTVSLIILLIFYFYVDCLKIILTEMYRLACKSRQIYSDLEHYG